MARVFHISDPHLSFDHDGKIAKDMSQRSWSKGSPNYVRYLEKIVDFSQKHITSVDYTCITGDFLHDMKRSHLVASLKWVENNILGTIIVIRGNHDQYWTAAEAKRVFSSPRVFVLDEGELITLGQYTFGCYSDHNEKTSKSPNVWYTRMAQNIVDQAKLKGTIPVMLSHYPVTPDVAEKIGSIGIRSYLSGHVHCTKGDAPGGSDWTWYDASAGLTDNKVINGCYFSTGTTDVVLVKTGNIFKEISCLETGITQEARFQSNKNRAAHSFSCGVTHVSHFERIDPYNKQNVVSGFMCRKEGPMAGSLFITAVNGISVEPQLIYGTPKLVYPYKPNSTEYSNICDFSKFILAEKLNGMNVLIYKYVDHKGDLFITAKSKGAPFLANSEYGNFLDLTNEALGQNSMDDLPDYIFCHMADENTQSVSLELYGRKEPHLVKYNHDIALQPLFITLYDGTIRPCNLDYAKEATPSALIAICEDSQNSDLEMNELFRSENGLRHKYEYEHFITEGRVLYLLDTSGNVINRTLYKIKPRDVEEVHWSTFDRALQNRVDEAIMKLGIAELPVNDANLASELDMGPKEWSKWGRAVNKYIAERDAVKAVKTSTNKVLVLVGIPGSGKSTYAHKLEADGWVRINQDDLGSRNKCKDLAKEALGNGKNVVIDRCNFDVRQRRSWIDLAAQYGCTVDAAVFQVSPEECIARILNRGAHPTLPPTADVAGIVGKFKDMYIEPTAEEGFSSITYIKQ